mgnify:CR=1 FL=1
MDLLLSSISDDDEEYARVTARMVRTWPHWRIAAGWGDILLRLVDDLSELDAKWSLRQVKGKFGLLQVASMSSLTGDELEAFRSRIRAAEEESGRTCEECSAPALRCDIKGYLYTLCADDEARIREYAG